MVRTFKILCPRCHSTSELYLSTNAPIVILNCPACWTPILRADDGVFLLTESQISDLAAFGESAISRLLDNIVPKERKEKQHAPANARPRVRVNAAHRRLAVPAATGALRDRITIDDILDLRIDLATCKDSWDFINRL